MIDCMHDCYVSVAQTKPSSKQLQYIKTNIPGEILLLGEQWGWNDTEVNDRVFLWINNNLKKNRKD